MLRFRCSGIDLAFALAVSVAGLSAVVPASADEPWDAVTLASPWVESWTGAQIQGTAWAVYSGVTLAPWSFAGDDGWRLRAVAGGGQYRQIHRGAERRATTIFGEVLAGYQANLYPLTARVFAGAAVDARMLAPPDLLDEAAQPLFGAKIATELWLDLTQQTFAQLDASFSSIRNLATARVRLGVDAQAMTPLPQLDDSSEFHVGIELAAQRSDVQDTAQATQSVAKAGLFASYGWAGGEISIAGGVGRETYDHSGRSDFGYGSVNWLTRY